MSSDILIRAVGLSKLYDLFDKPLHRLLHIAFGTTRFRRSFAALENISFTIGRGQTVGIIGRNGSGKSTLLQIICGTLTPTGGSVEVNGRIAALLELGSGFNPEFTGRENVYLNAALYGLSRAEIDARFAQIESFADIGSFIDQPVKTYSSGMYVRLAFAVIAHVNADILIVDEALAVGDIFFVQKCMRFLKDFVGRGGTLLFVSHDVAAVTSLCDHALLLRDGHLVMAGAPADVVGRYLAQLNEDEVRQKGDAALPADTAEVAPVAPSIALSPDEGFGTGHAAVESVILVDRATGAPLPVVKGGEAARLIVTSVAHRAIAQPIAGFLVKDRNGQYIFGGNTTSSHAHIEKLGQGERMVTHFDFVMPNLATGDYSITAAVSSGTQADHVHHHWLHDGFIIRMAPPELRLGLIGVPLSAIDVSITRAS